MLISLVWLYMIKCDVYAQLLADQTQKYFWVFYIFLKVFLYFRVLSFCSKCIFVLFFKNFFRGIFVRSSRLSSSHEKRLRQKLESTKFRQRLSHSPCQYKSHQKEHQAREPCYSGKFKLYLPCLWWKARQHHGHSPRD